LLRDIGATPAPFNSWLLIQGLETLAVRIKQHSNNALEVAKYLKSHPKVKKVSYPGLEGDEQNSRAKKYFKDGLTSGLLSFEVEDFDTAKNILNSAKLFSVVVNIGDSKSIITHPASTTHMQVPADELEKIGIKQGLIRLSVGLESPEDLIADLEQAIG
jgi:O-acetylhomoserine (thiol)-lyase